MKSKLLILTIFLFTNIVFSQMNATTEDGKKVILKNDKTWQFVDEGIQNNNNLSTQLSSSLEWVHIAELENGSEISFRPHSENSAWIKKTNQDIQIDKLKEKTKDNLTKGKTLTLFRFDCDNSKLGALTYVEYNLEGKVINSYNFEDYGVKMLNIVPDSDGALFFNLFCDSKEMYLKSKEEYSKN